jgi:uncharacterized membrane protein
VARGRGRPRVDAFAGPDPDRGAQLCGVACPVAPVPFGGALIYVPTDWVKPAEGGVERLMNVYVSMGVTPPVAMPSIADTRGQKALDAKPKSPKPPKPK